MAVSHNNTIVAHICLAIFRSIEVETTEAETVSDYQNMVDIGTLHLRSILT